MTITSGAHWLMNLIQKMTEMYCKVGLREQEIVGLPMLQYFKCNSHIKIRFMKSMYLSFLWRQDLEIIVKLPKTNRKIDSAMRIYLVRKSLRSYIAKFQTVLNQTLANKTFSRMTPKIKSYAFAKKILMALTSNLQRLNQLMIKSLNY